MRMLAANTRDISQAVVRQSVIVTAGTWITKLLFLGFNIVVVRWLGEVGLGHYTTVISFVGVFAIFFNLGMSQQMERSIARDPNQAANLFWNLVAFRCTLALFGVGIVTLLASVAHYEHVLVAGVLVYALTYILAAGQIPLTGVLKAHNRFDVVTACSLLSRVGSMAVGLVLLWSGVGFFALLLASFVTILVQIAGSIWAIRSNDIDLAYQRVTPRLWPSMMRVGLPFGLLAAGLSINANVITIVLGLVTDPGNVGWYNAAYRLVFHSVGVLGGFLVVMLPSLTRVYQRDPQQVARWTSSTFNWMILLVLPASAGLSLLAPRVIDLLYGSAYAPTGPVFRLIVWDIPLMLSVAFFANVCAAVGFERRVAGIYLAGMAANVAVAIAVIPMFGMMGAAAVNVVIDSAIGLTLALALRQYVHVSFDVLRLARIVVATVLMSAIVWICWSLPLALVASIGAVTYVICAIALGLVSWEMLPAELKRRFGFPAAKI